MSQYKIMLNGFCFSAKVVASKVVDARCLCSSIRITEKTIRGLQRQFDATTELHAQMRID